MAMAEVLGDEFNIISFYKLRRYIATEGLYDK
jgi:hypothetical protein